jgi:hypothetical protein
MAGTCSGRLAPFVGIFKVLEGEEHAKAEPAEPNAVYDGLSPEEFAAQFFGGGFVRQPQKGLTSLEWFKGQFKTKSAAIRYLHSDLGGTHPPKVIAKHIAVKIGSIFTFSLDVRPSAVVVVRQREAAPASRPRRQTIGC